MTTNTKLTAAIKLAKIRGYKELRTDQLDLLEELTSIDDISATEALNEVLSAPRDRFDRTIKLLRKQAAINLYNIAKYLEKD
jgi:hypothetical protein